MLWEAGLLVLIIFLVVSAAARAQGAATAAYDCTGVFCRPVAVYPTWDACEQKKAKGEVCGAPDRAAAVTQVVKGVEMYKGGYPQQRYANMESCMNALAGKPSGEGWSCVPPGGAKQDHPGESAVMYRCMVKACTAVGTFATRPECDAALPSQPKDGFDYTCGTLGRTLGQAPTVAAHAKAVLRSAI